MAASVGTFGVWVAELAAHLRSAISGTSAVKYWHNVAHDGSLSRLLSILQIDQMVWPGMGSEVIFELWEKREDITELTKKAEETKKVYYVRVLFGGQIMRSSNPSLGLLDMIPVDTLLSYFDGLVGENASLIKGKCTASS